MIRNARVLLLSFVLVQACRPEPRPPAENVPATRACANLDALGCPEARPNRVQQTCYQRLIAEEKQVLVPFDCIIGAVDVPAVRACGGPNTLRFRCVTAPTMTDGGK